MFPMASIFNKFKLKEKHFFIRFFYQKMFKNNLIYFAREKLKEEKNKQFINARIVEP